MKVKDLIQQLEKYPQDMDIKIRNNDYGHSDNDIIYLFALSSCSLDYPILFLGGGIREIFKHETEWIPKKRNQIK